LVNITGEEPFDVNFHEGSGGELGEQFTFSPKPGTTDFIPKGRIETAHKQGDEFRAILVELQKS